MRPDLLKALEQREGSGLAGWIWDYCEELLPGEQMPEIPGGHTPKSFLLVTLDSADDRLRSKVAGSIFEALAEEAEELNRTLRPTSKLQVLLSLAAACPPPSSERNARILAAIHRRTSDDAEVSGVHRDAILCLGGMGKVAGGAISDWSKEFARDLRDPRFAAAALGTLVTQEPMSAAAELPAVLRLLRAAGVGTEVLLRHIVHVGSHDVGFLNAVRQYVPSRLMKNPNGS